MGVDTDAACRSNNFTLLLYFDLLLEMYSYTYMHIFWHVAALISAQTYGDNDYIYHCLDNAVLRIVLCYNIRAYDICLKFDYCKIFSHTNKKYYAAPISNIIPHQYQNRVYAPTNIIYYNINNIL